MSRDQVYNPILHFLEKERSSSLNKNSQKLFSPASSKQQFFTLKRNNTKKSIQGSFSEHFKLNQSADRRDSDDFSKQDWESVNVSQQVYMNTSTDDDVKTTSTKSYDTHEDNQIFLHSNTKKKKHVQFMQTDKTTIDSSHNIHPNLNLDYIDCSIQNLCMKSQFSNLFVPQIPQKKQRLSKNDVLLKFKDNIKKKCFVPLRTKHFTFFPKPIGQGTYSKVYKAIHKKTGMICAIKVIQKQQIVNSNLIENLIEEIKIMSLYEHQNITKLWGVFDEGPKFYMILEYCTDGYLYNLIKDFQNDHSISELSYRKNTNYIKQICQAVEFLHQNKIMHRDIKPQNILLTMWDTVKLSDFGWARIIQDPSQQLRRTLCGTPLYLAPQQIKQTQYSKSVDLWAIGILTYELLTGKIPFTIESIEDLQKIVNEDVSFEEISCFPEAAEFVSLLLEKDGSKRLQAHKLTQHPFFDSDFGFDEKTFIYELQFGRFL